MDERPVWRLGTWQVAQPMDEKSSRPSFASAVPLGLRGRPEEANKVGG